MYKRRALSEQNRIEGPTTMTTTTSTKKNNSNKRSIK